MTYLPGGKEFNIQRYHIEAKYLRNRSSLGFMYQEPELGENEASTEAMLAALQLESLSNEENELSEELEEVEQDKIRYDEEI